MQPDSEGFLYPFVEESGCIDCSLCLDTCREKAPSYTDKQIIYAYSSPNENLRARSSSGGAFSVIAESLLKQGGVVYGAGFNPDYSELLHMHAENSEELDNLRRSKFIQSRKNTVYSEILHLLKADRKVLYTGTPCEIGALKVFLQKDYSNLLTCDLICGCVSSPGVYARYIGEMKDKYNSPVSFVNFKDKRQGWRGKGISIKFKNGSEYYSSILDDYYVVSFHSRFNIRPSCFSCKYRSLLRASDFTLGDFWGIEQIDKKLDDNKGLSLLLVNSAKGKKVLSSLDGDFHLIDILLEDYSLKYNWCVHVNPEFDNWESRKLFYKDLNSDPFLVVAEKHLKQIKEERKKRKR